MAQKTALILDDHPGVRGLLVAVCAGAGFKALAAGTCVAGLAMLRESPCDVVICDVAMPDLAGIEALQAIQKVQPRIPILITTDRGVDDRVMELLGAGAQLCLEKPFEVDFVVRALKNSVR